MTPSFWTEQPERWPFAEIRKSMGKEGLQEKEFRSSVLYIKYKMLLGTEEEMSKDS